MAVLQQSDPSWQVEVGVRPLVDLIGHRHKDGQRKHETVAGVGLGKGICDGEIHTGRTFDFMPKKIKCSLLFNKAYFPLYASPIVNWPSPGEAEN